MKKNRLLALILALCLLIGCCACGAPSNGGNGNDSGNSSNTNIDDLTPAEISDLAMGNFIKKLRAGNYVAGSADVVLTTAVSPEQIYFQYPHEGYPLTYAYMTLNGETFATLIEDNEIGDIEFVSRDNAIDAVEKVVPNYWINVTDSNLFEFFYNDPEKPLHFTSNDEIVKYTLCSLGGYGKLAMDQMQEVHMEFDSADPSNVHFTAEVPDYALYTFDDLDLTIKFGEAKGEPHIEEWFKKPVYPKVRTAWTSDDINDMDHVFMRGYGKDTVPFPDFASYAMIFDPKAYDEFTGMCLMDSHATEKNVEDYKKTLLDNGYKEVQEKQDDGSTATVYRKLLRENYRAYAELYPHYDNGFVMEGIMYYDDPSFEGLATMSGEVQRHGFAEFTETDMFEGWNATNMAASRSEGFAYFFDYDLYMPFILNFKDAAAAEAYWDDYSKKLLAMGFEEVYAAGENVREFRDPDASKIHRTTFGEDNVILEFKSESKLSAEEVNKMVAAYGIPAADLSGNVGGRDQARYRYEISGFQGLCVTATQYFENSAKAEAFLDEYTARLEDAGYDRIDPQKLSSPRQFLFLNTDEWKYVGFDYFPGDDGASVLFEFFSSEPAGKNVMLTTLNR